MRRRRVRIAAEGVAPLGAAGLLARPLLVVVLLSLAAGLAGGLLRAGLALPPDGLVLAGARAHGLLMLGGVFGTVIALERAIAMRHPLAFVAPAGFAAGGLLLLAGLPALAAGAFVIGATAMTGGQLVLLRADRSAHLALMTVAAGCAMQAAWLTVAGEALASTAIDEASRALWFGFLVLTIAAERLEMARLMRQRRAAAPMLALATATLLACAPLLLAAASPAAGRMVFGAGLLMTAAWLGTFDIARRTIRLGGLPRYMAVCLAGGYGWLAVAGAAWIAWGLGWAAGRDAALHALALGFVTGMVMAHAPVILPAVARVKLAFDGVFYGPLVLMHATLAWRLLAALVDPDARAVGALGNVMALVAFALVVVRAGWRWRRLEAAGRGIATRVVARVSPPVAPRPLTPGAEGAAPPA